MYKTKLLIKYKKSILGLFFVVFLLGSFNLSFRHGALTIQNKVFAETMETTNIESQQVSTESQVTVNFLDSNHQPIQAPESFMAKIGQHIWVLSPENKVDQINEAVHHFYIAPAILGYSFQAETSNFLILVNKEATSNIINLYYQKNSPEIVYSFDYEYAADTPDKSLQLPNNFILKKGENPPVIKLPDGYELSKIVDNKGNSYMTTIEAINSQLDDDSHTFKLIVSAKPSPLDFTVEQPNNKATNQSFSGLYGENYQLPIASHLSFEGKDYQAIVKITKKDWTGKESTVLIDKSDELSSLLNGGFLLGKYDSAELSISVAYKEEAPLSLSTPKNEEKKSSGQTPNSSTSKLPKENKKPISTTLQKDQNQAKVESSTSQVTNKVNSSSSTSKNEESNKVFVQSPTSKASPAKILKENKSPISTTLQKDQNQAKKILQAEPKLPTAQSNSEEKTSKANVGSAVSDSSKTKRTAKASSSIFKMNQQAHMLKLRIAGMAGLAVGTAVAFGILEGLKTILQHLGNLNQLFK